MVIRAFFLVRTFLHFVRSKFLVVWQFGIIAMVCDFFSFNLYYLLCCIFDLLLESLFPTRIEQFSTIFHFTFIKFFFSVFLCWWFFLFYFELCCILIFYSLFDLFDLFISPCERYYPRHSKKTDKITNFICSNFWWLGIKIIR